QRPNLTGIQVPRPIPLLPVKRTAKQRRHTREQTTTPRRRAPRSNTTTQYPVGSQPPPQAPATGRAPAPAPPASKPKKTPRADPHPKRGRRKGRAARSAHAAGLLGPSATAMVSTPSPSPPFPTATPETKKRGGGGTTASEKVDRKYAHAATPLHHNGATKKTPRGGASKGDGADQAAGYVAAVSCSDCRFKQRALAPASPGAVIRSLFVSLTRRSTPRSSPSPSSGASDGVGGADGGEQWRLAAADLSRRLAAATRTRDEAVEETTRLKHSLAELELKLARLEARVLPTPPAAAFPVESFLRAVSTSRAAVRNLARALSAHLRGSPAASPGSSPNLESFLNRAFHAGFELDTDAEALQTPDPAGRCEANLAAYHAVAALTWDEVLLHGTKHYSEGLSRFCDAKMSEVVASLGWARARAWPEPLLQAFFLAAKGVWGVRLLARSVHPPLPVVRAERGARFDPRFMEDAAAGRAGRLEPASVKMMVAPGFHVYLAGAGVVKCKVVCFYSSSSNGRTDGHRDGGSSANGGGVGLGSSCTDINGSATTDVVESCKTSRVG
ncbi:hypothetical protein EJB05_07339, partial [Eragrostis curvula]